MVGHMFSDSWNINLFSFESSRVLKNKQKTKLYSPMQKSSACLWMLQRLGLIGNRSDSLITLYLPLITCPMNQARSHGRLILKIPLDEVPKGEIMSKWLVYHIKAFEQSTPDNLLPACSVQWSLHFLLKCLKSFSVLNLMYSCVTRFLYPFSISTFSL